MVRRCLVLDLHASHARLAVASSDRARAHEIVDAAGRRALPLQSPLLWSGATAAPVIAVRVRAVERLLRSPTRRHGAREDEDEEPLRVALDALLGGAKAFAESREECDLDELAVVAPASWTQATRDLVAASGRRAGFAQSRTQSRAATALAAYEIDQQYTVPSRIGRAVVVSVEPAAVSATVVEVEEGIYETLAAVCDDAEGGERDDDACVELVKRLVREAAATASVVLDGVDEFLLVGEAGPAVSDRVRDEMETLLPNATQRDALPAADASLLGAMALAHRRLQSVTSSEILCCLTPTLLTVAVETHGGLAAPLLPRNYLLPAVVRSRVGVYVEQEDSASVELRVCEGQRAFARDNTPIGVLRVDGLRRGWNEICIRTAMSFDLQLTVDASVVERAGDASTARLAVQSSTAGMRGGELTAYFDALGDEQRLRQAVESRECVDDLLRAAARLVGRADRFARAGAVVTSYHRIDRDRCGAAVAGVDAFLCAVAWPAAGETQQRAAHDALADLLGAGLSQDPFATHRCAFCADRQSALPVSPVPSASSYRLT